MKKTIGILSIGLLLLMVACSTPITNFDECVKAGNPVMESYPEQCRANGQTFVNERQVNETPAIGMPVPGETVNETIVKPSEKISPMPANETLPPAVTAAKEYVEQKSGKQAIVLNVQEVDWSDSCLGTGGPAESCLFAITPGYNITVHSGEYEYEIHTPLDGSYVREAGKNKTGAIMI